MSEDGSYGMAGFKGFKVVGSGAMSRSEAAAACENEGARLANLAGDHEEDVVKAQSELATASGSSRMRACAIFVR